MKIEIKESSVDSKNLYLSYSYNGVGIYLNTDENNVKTLMCVGIDIVAYIGDISLINALGITKDAPKEDEKEEVKEGFNVTEDFLLKLVAVTNGNVNQIEL